MNKLSNFFGKNSQPIMVRTMRSADEHQRTSFFNTPVDVVNNGTI